MNDKRRLRLLVGLIVLLAALNVGLLGWLWLRPEPKWAGAARTSSGLRLADTLAFDEQQRQQFTALQQRFFRELRPRQLALRQARQAYFQLPDSSLTVAERRQRLLAFHQQAAETELLTLAHFDRVAAICRPPQRRLLGTLMHQMAQSALFRRPGAPPFGRGSGRWGRYRAGSPPDSTTRP